VNALAFSRIRRAVHEIDLDAQMLVVQRELLHLEQLREEASDDGCGSVGAIGPPALALRMEHFDLADCIRE
jgi:hypothetical protein